MSSDREEQTNVNIYYDGGKNNANKLFTILDFQNVLLNAVKFKMNRSQHPYILIISHKNQDFVMWVYKIVFCL